jgi:hypothetical protein
MPLRAAIAPVELEELPVSDQVTDGHRLRVERLRLAPAPRLITVALKLDQLWQP